jgi:hypothetical protein
MFESPELMAKQQEMAIKGVNRDTLPRGISVLNESKQSPFLVVLPLIPDFQTAPSKEGACVNL